MLDLNPIKQIVGLDVGCAHGYFTQQVARRLKGTVIGIDVCINDLYKAKIRARLRECCEKSMSGETTEYVLCNVNNLPFKEGAFDVVTCISVLEHFSDLEGAVKEIEASMANKGLLIAGYPIETRLFMALLKVFLPSGIAIRDPKIRGKEKFGSMPDTHKQSFKAIRDRLQKHLVMIQRQKSFFSVFPDQLSWYECVKMYKEKVD